MIHRSLATRFAFCIHIHTHHYVELVQQWNKLKLLNLKHNKRQIRIKSTTNLTYIHVSIIIWLHNWKKLVNAMKIRVEIKVFLIKSIFRGTNHHLFNSLFSKKSHDSWLTCLERLKIAVGLAGLLWREAVPADGGFGPSSGSRSSAFSTGKPE